MKSWKRMAALSSAIVMAAATLTYFPSDTLQNIRLEISASAETTTEPQVWIEDNLTWTLDADGKLTISGTGAMKDYSSSEGNRSPAHNNSNVKKVVIEDGVTSIGNQAFPFCQKLASVTIPDSVTSIENYAFSECSSLTDIVIPNSVTSIGNSVFKRCSNLSNITLSNNITSIGSGAFTDCRSLPSITIPDSVTSIGGNAFSDCRSLTSITIPDKVTSIEYAAFDGCSSLTSITIPDSITSIGDFAFRYCKSLPSITIPDSVTSIGNSAFFDCSSLTSITIPDSVTSIGNSVFRYCSSLTNITIPDSVTSIGNYAFRYCKNLPSITIPDSVTSIGTEVFQECTSLQTISLSCKSTLKKSDFGEQADLVSSLHILKKTEAINATCTEDGNKEYWTCEHCGKYFLSDDTNPETATAVELSETVIPAIQHKNAIIRDISEPNGTKPGYSGDRYCPDCNTVLEKGYTYWNEDNLIWRLYEDGTLNISGIGAMKNYDTYLNDDNRSPVDNNTKIKKVVIEKGVTSIGNYAFSRCWGLNSITIPDSVTSIGDYAFDSCINLKSITLPDSITSIGMWAFHNCLNVPSIIIPDGVTSIEDSTFDSCISLTSIAIPNSVTKIKSSAFHNCADLTSITIPDSVTSIGDSVFSDCNSLKTISLSCGSALKKSDFGDQADLVSYTNQHTLIKTAAKAPTCTEDGNKEYWTCEHCGKYFLSDDSNPETATAVELSETVISALKHKNTTTRGASEPTETEPGYSGDRYCPDCNTVLEKGYTYWIEDNLTWKLYADGTLNISGTGAMKDYNSDDNRSPVYNNSNVKKIVVEKGVTSIGKYAFYICKSLTSITIPDSVTSIGDASFRSCSNLTSITLPDSVTSIGDYAFGFCVGLSSITIPDSVTNIGEHAFSSCSSLTSITIPDSVTSIGDSAFYNCSSLTSITIPDSVTSIGDWTFYKCSSLTNITIPDGVTSIGYDAFHACSSLSSITIPDSVTSIEPYAFFDCWNLTSITIPDSVTRIGDYAFENCSSLQTISLSCKSSLKKSDFGNQADLVSASHTLKKTEAKTATCSEDGNKEYWTCEHCGKYFLQDDTNPETAKAVEQSETIIPASHKLTKVKEEKAPTCTEDGNKEYWTCEHCGKYFLSDDTNPETATAVEQSETILPALNHKNAIICGAVEPTETEPGYSGDRYCPDCDTVLEKGYTYWNEGNLIWKLDADGTLTISGTGAMKDYNDIDNLSPAYCNSKVKKVVIEDGVTSIGDSAFESCNTLISITIPDGVTSIGEYAFCNCTSLTSITIPDGVTSIGEYAFYGCNSLTSITIPGSVTSIETGTFYNCSSLTDIVIPNSVTSIGYAAFYGCNSLTSITIPGSVTSIESSTFYGCNSLTSITIPDSVTSIGYAAFNSCGSLTSITIPDSVTSIGRYAFQNCSSLTSITIPDSVTSIGDSAFYSCEKLTSITIPDSVTSIGDAVFSNCESLTAISLSCKSSLKRSDFGDQADLVSYASHPLKKIEAKAATCTENGNIEYWTCEYCKKYFLSDDTNPETATAVELSETVIPALVQVATATTTIKCVYGQNMDEIDLRDYVKNTDVVGEVSVKVAAGSTLPDGIKLDGSKLFGKPAKAYEDGKEVTFTFTAENGNTADLTLLFLVEKADPTVEVAVSGDSHTEGDLVDELELILSENSTKGVVEIVSEIKALVAGKNTLTWKFTPEDENNYNIVTGTVVVNAQTTTTTTTTTKPNTTTTTKTTATTKPNMTTTTKTTVTTKPNTTTTTKTTATTKPGTTITSKTITTTKPGTTTTSKITVTTNKTTSSTMTTKTTTMSSVTTTNTTAPSYGDINLDGKVDIVDAIFLNKYLATLIQFSDVQLANADCYQDGVLNDQDATALMQFIVLLIDDLPTQPDQK